MTDAPRTRREGDALTDAELDTLIEQLRGDPDYLVLSKAADALIAMRDRLRAELAASAKDAANARALLQRWADQYGGSTYGGKPVDAVLDADTDAALREKQP